MEITREYGFNKIFDILEEVDAVKYGYKFKREIIIPALSQLNMPTYKER